MGFTTLNIEEEKTGKIHVKSIENIETKIQKKKSEIKAR